MTLQDYQIKLRRLIDSAYSGAHNVTLSSISWEMIAMDLKEAATLAQQVAHHLKKAEPSQESRP